MVIALGGLKQKASSKRVRMMNPALIEALRPFGRMIAEELAKLAGQSA
jgi:hypothetical protein